MKSIHLSAVAILLSLPFNVAFAYGSSSGSSSCTKPSFSEFQPSANKYLQSFREFSFVASSNTTASSVEVTVSAGPVKQHFVAKQLDITQHPSGRLQIKGKLDRPFQHGFARISMKAHSKPGCEKADGYLIRVQ
jgi:hypothetical protein